MSKNTKWTPEQFEAYEARQGRGQKMAQTTQMACACAAGKIPKPSKAEQVSEKEMHRLFANWLNLQEFLFLEARMDKPSTIMEGWPDFTVFHKGKTAFVELKVLGASLREEQAACIAALRQDGFAVAVCRSAQEAIDFAAVEFLKG